ncbi:MAG: phosphatase PAP2 family protein [Ilumatobacteraceae bacterium]
MDSDIFLAVNRFADRTPWAHGFFTAFTTYGVVVFALLLVVVFLDGRRTADPHMVAASIWAGASALVAVGIGQIIGGAMGRSRPYNALSGVHLLVDRTTDFSFPSDHATAVGAVAVGLLFAHRRWGLVACVLAVLMGFSRVYVGAHYPTDVVGGLALGAVVAVAGRAMVVPALVRLADRVEQSRWRFLVVGGSRDLTAG